MNQQTNHQKCEQICVSLFTQNKRMDSHQTEKRIELNVNKFTLNLPPNQIAVIQIDQIQYV